MCRSEVPPKGPILTTYRLFISGRTYIRSRLIAQWRLGMKTHAGIYLDRRSIQIVEYQTHAYLKALPLIHF